MSDMENVIKGIQECDLNGGLIGNCPYKGILDLLKEQETVDKNTGEWKNGHCSCCGEDVSSMLDTWTNVQNFLFCPKCGAKMKER